MDRQDDTAIAGDMLLYRRVPPWGGHVQWDEVGVPTPSSINFRDKANELSVTIAAETSVDSFLEGHEGFGLVQFTAGQVRDLGCPDLILCRDEPPPGHVLIRGKISNGKSVHFKKFVQWVEGRWPARLPAP